MLVLTWNSSSQSRLEQVHRVVAHADIAGGDAAGLVLDLDGYLPSEAVWEQLAHFQTRQRATITGLRTPDSWARIVAGNRVRLGSGAAAFTVHAIRRRDGVLDGTPVSSISRVSFTMFVSCARRGVGYRLVRLSRLGDPLP